MAYTRRQLLRRTAAAAGAAGLIQAAGIYGLLDGLARIPTRVEASGLGLPPEQHLIQGIQTITDNGVEVLVPPLHHQVVTAKLRVSSPGASGLKGLQKTLEGALQTLDQRYANTPSGLNVVVAWGLPYFNTYLPGPWQDHQPKDLRAGVPAILDAIRFPSDPPSTILEQNDLAVCFASDSLANIGDGAQTIFGAHSDFLQVTSIRKGFVGGGFGGGQSLPKAMALAAGVPGADKIPDSAELFMGFTSTQKLALGPDRIANLESLGLTDQKPPLGSNPASYFCNGTTLHVSHLFEDLVSWYANPFSNRVDRVFRPGITPPVPAGTLTVPEGPATVESESQVFQDLQQYGKVGHSSALQPGTRLQTAVTDVYGTQYPAGTAIPQRADFDTLDNPFFGNGGYQAGLHFLVFAPTSDAFHRGRLAMDGHYSDGRVLGIDPHGASAGFNSVLTTTHRQNFLVPPRAHRSFPLAELL